MLTSRIIDADDALTDHRTKEIASHILEPQGIKSLLIGTIRDLRYNENIQGTVNLEMKKEQREWTIEEKMFLTSITDLLSQRLSTSKLDKSEANYRAIFEASEESIILFKEGRLASAYPNVRPIWML